MEKKRARGRTYSEWESERWRGGREGWAKTSGRERECAVGWVGGWWGSEALVGRSWLGARAECLVWKQAEQCAAAKPEIQLCRKRASFLPPNLHSHLLPSPCIHHPIHHPLYSTAWPPLLDSATLSNRPDGLGEIHPTVCSRLNLPLLSWAALFPSTVLPKCLLENQLSTMSLWYEAMCAGHYTP